MGALSSSNADLDGERRELAEKLWVDGELTGPTQELEDKPVFNFPDGDVRRGSPGCLGLGLGKYNVCNVC